MKLDTYTFIFKSGTISIAALSYEQAKILAQAEAIKRGWDYTVHRNWKEVIQAIFEEIESCADYDGLLNVKNSLLYNIIKTKYTEGCTYGIE